MQKLVVAIAIFLTILSTSALAKDLPVKAPPPPPAPVYSWSGWYAGLNAGYAWSNHTSIDVVGTPNFASALNGAPQGLAGAVAGATTSIPVGNGGVSSSGVRSDTIISLEMSSRDWRPISRGFPGLDPVRRLIRFRFRDFQLSSSTRP